MLDGDVGNAFFIDNRTKLGFLLLKDTGGKLGGDRRWDISAVIA